MMFDHCLNKSKEFILLFESNKKKTIQEFLVREFTVPTEAVSVLKLVNKYTSNLCL